MGINFRKCGYYQNSKINSIKYYNPSGKELNDYQDDMLSVKKNGKGRAINKVFPGKTDLKLEPSGRIFCHPLVEMPVQSCPIL